jgi:DNA polymerase-3 subunit beta
MFEVIVQRSVFLKALSHVQSVVERKNISEISSHLKLEASGTTITLTALDSTLSITTVIAADIEANGALTLPVHTLYDIVRKLSDETIKLRIDPNQTSMVEISSGYSVFHLSYLKAEKFPRIDVGNFDCKFTIPASSLQKIIEKNRNTISQEDSRYHLNGIYLHPILETNELRGTATDGHRLSSTRVQLPKDAKNMQGIIIPRKTIFEISKMISDKDAEITIESSNSKIKFTIDSLVIISKLIDAEFPDYLPLIPYNNSLSFNLPSADLSRAVDRATTILMDKSQAIEFIVNGNQLEIKAGGEHQSLANEKLEISGNMDQFRISFNARYVMDILSAIGNNVNVEFKFSDQISPTLVQSQEDDKTDFVIMPMRV